MKLKGFNVADITEIQEAVTDELKEVQKHFRNCTTAQKPVYMLMEFILNKIIMSLPHVFSIFKKLSPKTSGTHCVKLSILLPVSIAGSNTRVASLTRALRKTEDLKIYPCCS